MIENVGDNFVSAREEMKSPATGDESVIRRKSVPLQVNNFLNSNNDPASMTTTTDEARAASFRVVDNFGENLVATQKEMQIPATRRSDEAMIRRKSIPLQVDNFLNNNNDPSEIKKEHGKASYSSVVDKFGNNLVAREEIQPPATGRGDETSIGSKSVRLQVDNAFLNNNRGDDDILDNSGGDFRPRNVAFDDDDSSMFPTEMKKSAIIVEAKRVAD